MKIWFIDQRATARGMCNSVRDDMTRLGENLAKIVPLKATNEKEKVDLLYADSRMRWNINLRGNFSLF